MDQVATRQLRFEPSDSDGKTLVGLAVPFNEVTRIDNAYEGTFDEQFVRGAFRRSLGRTTPKLQFDHGTHPLFGSLPVGEFRKLTETSKGLEFEARIFDAELFAPLREAIASTAIDGVSVRFRPTVVEIEERPGDVELRSITEAELIELGPVIFPAYAGTAIDLRSIDLTDHDDRHRLAEALLAGVSLDRGCRDHPNGPGPDSAPESPATTTDPDLVASVRSGVPELQTHKDFYKRWISKS